MSHSYPSDISREQFVRILPTLESARRRTKPRTVNLYDVFCGVLYLLKSGCQWRMLPVDFPDWRTCYQYFRQWSERPGPGQDSILERVLKKIGWRGPTKQWTERADQLLYRGLPVSRAAAKRTTGTVDSRNPTIGPPTWPTLPPPFTALTKYLDVPSVSWGIRVLPSSQPAHKPRPWRTRGRIDPLNTTNAAGRAV